MIWCEDHGDLAFFRDKGVSGPGAIALDAGDLVEFEVETYRDLRFAHNPQVVSERYYPEVQTDIAPSAKAQPRRAAPQPPRQTARIIPFRLFDQDGEPRKPLSAIG